MERRGNRFVEFPVQFVEIELDELSCFRLLPADINVSPQRIQFGLVRLILVHLQPQRFADYFAGIVVQAAFNPLPDRFGGPGR